MTGHFEKAAGDLVRPERWVLSYSLGGSVCGPIRGFKQAPHEGQTTHGMLQHLHNFGWRPCWPESPSPQRAERRWHPPHRTRPTPCCKAFAILPTKPSRAHGWHWTNGNVTEEGITKDLEVDAPRRHRRLPIGGCGLRRRPDGGEEDQLWHAGVVPRGTSLGKRKANGWGWRCPSSVRPAGAKAGGPWVKTRRGHEAAGVERDGRRRPEGVLRQAAAAAFERRPGERLASRRCPRAGRAKQRRLRRRASTPIARCSPTEHRPKRPSMAALQPKVTSSDGDVGR